MPPNDKPRRRRSPVATAYDRVDELLRHGQSTQPSERSGPSSGQIISPISENIAASYTVPDRTGASPGSAHTPEAALPLGDTQAQKPPEITSKSGSSSAHEWPKRVPIDSAGIYRFNSKTYCGKPKEYPVPQQLQDAWDKPEGIHHRLLIDLRPIVEEARAKGRAKPLAEFRLWEELRMSGSRDYSRSAPSVLLYPRVWIFCSSKWYKRLIDEALKSLSWLDELFPRPVEVHVGGPSFCMAMSCVSLPQLQIDAAGPSGFNLAGGKIIYHLEKPQGQQHYPSPCGLLCCATFWKDGAVVHQHVSRIGGLLTDRILGSENPVESKFATTAAHGVLKYLLPGLGSESRGNTSERSNDQSDTDSDDADDSDDDSSFEDEARTPTSTENSCYFPENIGRKDPGSVERWVVADEVSAINFLGQKLPPHHGPEKAALAGDHVLLRSDFLQDFQNYYTHSGMNMVNTYASDAELYEGRILLLLDPDNVVECDLLPGESQFTTLGADIPTRKIQLSNPLAPGTSGTWLVRGNALCGMIIANYPGEPLALFITAERILRDIAQSFPDLGKSGQTMDIDPPVAGNPQKAPGESARGRPPTDPKYPFTLLDGDSPSDAIIQTPYATVVRLAKRDQTTMITKDLVSQEALGMLQLRYTEHETHYSVQKCLEDGTLRWLTQYSKTCRAHRGVSPSYGSWHSAYGARAAEAKAQEAGPERRLSSGDPSGPTPRMLRHRAQSSPSVQKLGETFYYSAPDPRPGPQAGSGAHPDGRKTSWGRNRRGFTTTSAIISATSASGM